MAGSATGSRVCRGARINRTSCGEGGEGLRRAAHHIAHAPTLTKSERTSAAANSHAHGGCSRWAKLYGEPYSAAAVLSGQDTSPALPTSPMEGLLHILIELGRKRNVGDTAWPT